MSANSSIISSSRRGRGAGNYVAALLATVVLFLAASSAARFTVLAPIAPRFTGNASLDQKLLFIKQQNFGATPLSVIAGSSMALNNIDADELEKSEGVRYLNTGVWAFSVAQTAEFVSLLESRFNVKELTLSVQFFELADEKPAELPISGDDFRRYLSNDLWMTLTRFTDILDALATKSKWAAKYGNPHNYEYLGFTETGSVPLDITKNEIVPGRWSPSQPFVANCQLCMSSLANMCVAARQRQTPFYVVLPPITHHIRDIRPEVGAFYEDRRQRLAATVADCGGRLFDAGHYADVDDDCFADFAHLNAEGDRKMAQLFIRWKQGTLQLPTKPDAMDCDLAKTEITKAL